MKTTLILAVLVFCMFAIQAKDQADQRRYVCEQESGTGRCEEVELIVNPLDTGCQDGIVVAHE